MERKTKTKEILERTPEQEYKIYKRRLRAGQSDKSARAGLEHLTNKDLTVNLEKLVAKSKEKNLEKLVTKSKDKKRKKWIIINLILVFIACISVALMVGGLLGIF